MNDESKENGNLGINKHTKVKYTGSPNTEEETINEI